MYAPDSHPGKELIENFGLKLAGHTEILDEILKMMNGRGEHWPWVETWITEEASDWTNSPDNLVFEVRPGQLVDRQAVELTQQVWMCQPRLFEHQTWGGRTFVRISWAKCKS